MAEKTTKPQNSRIFMKGLNSSPLGKLYLFLGEEEHEKEKCARIIAAKHTGTSEGKPYSSFYGDSESVLSCAQFVLEQSIFSNKKCAFLTGIDSSNGKKETSLILEMIDSITDDTILIMTSGANQAPAFLKKSISKIETVIFWRMFESELLKYIPEQFALNGRKIDIPGSSRIVALCGRDLGKIDAAIRRILDGTDEKNISAPAVIRLIADEREVKIFDFIDMTFRKRKDALVQLKKLLSEDVHELQILALIEREMERIERFRMLTASGSSPSEAAHQAGVLPQNTDDFSARAAKFSPQEIRSIYRSIHQTDFLLKSGSPQSFLANPLSDLVSTIIR